jgi:hypothetical protein
VYPVLQLPQLGFRILGCGDSVVMVTVLQNTILQNTIILAESITRERKEVDAYTPLNLKI